VTELPVIFLSHGPPLMWVTPCPARRFMKRLGGKFPKPRAILCVSAHWESTDPIVTLGDRPDILLDFGGSIALQQLSCELAGAPWLADSIIDVLSNQGFQVQGMHRGFDHGTWIPLSLMYPQADIPVVQLSIQTEADATHHFHLGKALSPLRKSGVLILASGGAVHNIDEAGEYAIDADPPEYASQFDRWLEKQIVTDQTAMLLDFRQQAPQPQRCHPYPHEHLLPLFAALGAANGAYARRLHDSFLFGTLSMAAYAWE
jgi:4,5-DOPA dioxygenase extradiol